MQLRLRTRTRRGKEGPLVQRVGHVEQVVVRSVDGKIQVYWGQPCAGGLVQFAHEDVVPTHRVVALGGEVQRLPIGVHEGKVFVKTGIDGSFQLLDVDELAVEDGGLVDVLAGFGARTVAREVNHIRPFREVDHPHVAFLAVGLGLEVFGRGEDLAANAGHVVKAEEFLGGRFGLVQHHHIGDAREQALAVAAHVHLTCYRELGLHLVVGFALEGDVRLLCGLKVVVAVVRQAQVVPGLHGSALTRSEIEVLDGRGLFLAAQQGAGAKAIIELRIARIQAHQLGIQRQRLRILAGSKELSSLIVQARMFCAYLCMGLQKQTTQQEQECKCSHTCEISDKRYSIVFWPLSVLG